MAEKTELDRLSRQHKGFCRLPFSVKYSMDRCGASCLSRGVAPIIGVAFSCTGADPNRSLWLESSSFKPLRLGGLRVPLKSPILSIIGKLPTGKFAIRYV